MSRAPAWTDAETATLTEMWNAGAAKEVISATLPGRTPAACQVKAYAMGMKADATRRTMIHGSPEAFAPWSYEERDVFEFARLWHGNDTVAQIAMRLGRPAHAIKNHATRLGLGPRKSEFESLHWYQPAKPRLRLCYACEVRLPQGDFEGPNDRTCKECSKPGASTALELPTITDTWSDDLPIGGAK